jgi:hypothetical protein
LSFACIFKLFLAPERSSIAPATQKIEKKKPNLNLGLEWNSSFNLLVMHCQTIFDTTTKLITHATKEKKNPQGQAWV